MRNTGLLTILVVFYLIEISVVHVKTQKTSVPSGKIFGSLFNGGLFGSHHHHNKPNQPSGNVTQTEGDAIEPVDPTNLKLVIVVTRHGSRAPTETYPNDPYPYSNQKYWPEGRGGLTRYGKLQMYRLGQNLRRRYLKYLAPEYRDDEVKVSSNPIERILMSAQCLATGLFPPKSYQIWNPNINWQPVPVYEERFDVTKVISSSSLCPRAVQEENKAIKRIEKKFSSNFSKVFDILSEHSGEDVRSISAVLGYYDVFQLQYENGLDLPHWTRDIFPEPVTTMSAIGNQALTAGTPKLIRLTAGPVLKSIHDRMKRKIDRASGYSRKKMFIDAAHDNTLIALFAGLGHTEPVYPGTSSYMAFELRQSGNRKDHDLSGLTVKAFFFNSSAVVTPTRLRIPNCKSDPCSFEHFGRLVKDMSPKNWDNECSR